MRLSPELSLQHNFTLSHVQLMKLLPMLTIKLNVVFNAVNVVTSLWLSGLYTAPSNTVLIRFSTVKDFYCGETHIHCQDVLISLAVYP